MTMNNLHTKQLLKLICLLKVGKVNPEIVEERHTVISN